MIQAKTKKPYFIKIYKIAYFFVFQHKLHIDNRASVCYLKIKREVMSNLKYGKLGEYLFTKAIERTNIDAFLTQDVLDEVNANICDGQTKYESERVKFKFDNGAAILFFYYKNNSFEIICSHTNGLTKLTNRDEKFNMLDYVTIDSTGGTFRIGKYLELLPENPQDQMEA